LQDAWRKDKKPAAAPQSAQDARALAEASFESKKQRLQNGWRNR
jgi:hypothetical protein